MSEDPRVKKAQQFRRRKEEKRARRESRRRAGENKLQALDGGEPFEDA